MNRIIKFRGKTNDGDWIYGSYVKTRHYANGRDLHKIIRYEVDYADNREDVIPETVCQFTGLYDKTGKEIYEGDIIVCINGSIDGAEWEFKLEIKWSEKRCGFNTPIFGCDEDRTHYYNVIGNIHDNPELIKN